MSCISQRLGFSKRIDSFGVFSLLAGKGLGIGRNWVHIFGIWDLFKLVNIRWFFLCSVYIFRVCSIIDMVGGFVCISFCLLFLLSFGEKNKTKVVVCCFDVLIVKIYTCTAVSIFPLLDSISHHLRHSNFLRLQSTQLSPSCFLTCASQHALTSYSSYCSLFFFLLFLLPKSHHGIHTIPLPSADKTSSRTATHAPSTSPETNQTTLHRFRRGYLHERTFGDHRTRLLPRIVGIAG